MYNPVTEELKRRIKQIKLIENCKRKISLASIYILLDIVVFKNPKNANASQLNGIKNVGVKRKKQVLKRMTILLAT